MSQIKADTDALRATCAACWRAFTRVLLPCRIAAMVARNASVSALIWLIVLPLFLVCQLGVSVMNVCYA